MSTAAQAPARPRSDDAASAAPPAPPLGRRRVVMTVGLAAVLVAIAFVTGGGLDSTTAASGNVWTEIALLALGAVAVGAGLLLAPGGDRRFGWVTAGLMGVMFADFAASIAWSAVPDASWLASGQMLAYLAVFAGAIALARSLRDDWAAIVGALALWALAVSAWSLLVKVFPATLAPNTHYGRLQAPFGYWNAIALAAAMGVPCCLWLGARRGAGRRLAALAAPGLTLLVSVLVLSYSRSADLAAVVVAAVWLAVVPVRLRAVAMAAVGAAGGAVVSAWALTHSALHGDGVALAAQDHAGHAFGIVLVVVLVATGVLGVAVSESMDRTTTAPATRRRIGAGLLGLVGIAVIAALAAVAASHRGFGGEISYRWGELVNPAATVSAGSATRVFQFGSSRPLYWHQALFVGDHAVLKGVGELGYSVARLADPTSTDVVFQAHSWVFETYADLGIVGLLVSAALLVAWLWASGRTLRGVPRRSDGTGEWPALATLGALVLAFGIQGTLDWTWYFAGLAVPALVAAGWLAGRGPAGVPSAAVAGSALDRPARLAAVPVLVAVVLLGGWLVWRPLHSVALTNTAVNTGSLPAARAAHSADPFALEPYQVLSQFAASDHDSASARSWLTAATRQQPRNPFAWAALGQYLVGRHQWRAAVPALHEVQVLDRASNPMSSLNDRLIQQAFHHGA